LKANRRQTEGKQKANRRQTEGKQKANRRQTEGKTEIKIKTKYLDEFFVGVPAFVKPLVAPEGRQHVYRRSSSPATAAAAATTAAAEALNV
jgi:hypothetical protein